MTGRAIFTPSYAVIPRGVQTDIVTSFLPHWQKTRLWILARPLSGFAETFSQYLMEVQPGGGNAVPEAEPGVASALFVTGGTVELHVDGVRSTLGEGGFAYIPPGSPWTLTSLGRERSVFHWFRKRYQPVDGIEMPGFFTASDQEIAATPMPDTDGRWATTRFMDPGDLRHDFHITIVTLQPGAVIPFDETHVMEHGLYVLQGKGVYKLNTDWVEVEAGDFMWLRAFCPQACYAGGPGPFRYLLYKDVNRHVRV